MKKKTIRLTESDLKKIVTESVKRALKESTLYCDTKPFEDIIKATNTILEKFEYVNDEDWEPSDDCDGRDLTPEVYNWAKKVREDAEDWLRQTSAYSPINGGEDW